MMGIGTRWLGAACGIALGAMILAAAPAWAAKDRFVVDLVNEPSSLDPQLQWNPDSYYVYRNVFDNLVTRDDAGKIAPEVATSWKTPRHRDRIVIRTTSPSTEADRRGRRSASAASPT